MAGFRCLAFGGFQLLRSKIFGGFWGNGLLDFKGRLVEMVVVVVVGRFASGGLWLWVTVTVGSGCAVEIWWWLRFFDGGGRGRWMGFVI